MEMNRRNFIALASGLLVPWQPERVYSFLPAWQLVDRDWYATHVAWLGLIRVKDAYVTYDCVRHLVKKNSELWVNSENLLDILKSADAYGLPRPVVL